MVDDFVSELLLSSDLDKLFAVFASKQRRVIIHGLHHDIIDHQHDVMDCHRHIQATELVHNHLPKLVDAGYIEWDRESGNISPGPRFAEGTALLEIIEIHADDIPLPSVDR